MKNNEFYKCPNCGGRVFTLQFRTYEEFEEEFHGEFLTTHCVQCDREYFSFAVDQRLFKHIEMSWISEELGEPLKKPKDIE